MHVIEARSFWPWSLAITCMPSRQAAMAGPGDSARPGRADSAAWRHDQEALLAAGSPPRSAGCPCLGRPGPSGRRRPRPHPGPGPPQPGPSDAGTHPVVELHPRAARHAISKQGRGTRRARRRRACSRRPAGPRPGRTRSPSVVTWTWPGCGSAWTTPTRKVCVKIPSRRPRAAAGHAGSANDPGACCGEVLPRLAWMVGAPRQNGASRERAS